MSTDKRADFAVEFLDDYFAECDEHLMTMRRVLLALEPFVHQPPADRSLLDTLFRSLHSIKGLSGMVGVSVAEELAHQMESYLRALRRKQLPLTVEGMDALVAGARTLEGVIAARRAQQPPPDTAPILAQFAAILGIGSDAPSPAVLAAPTSPATTLTTASTPLALNGQESARLDAALADGMRTWCVEFTPAPALAERGVTVDGIRARLQDIGELIHAAPRVTSGGGIAFVFLVASYEDETAFSGWHDDGLAWAPYEAHAPESVQTSVVSEMVPSVVPSNVVRVDLARLDELMQMVGELVISRARLEDNLKDLGTVLPISRWRTLQEINLALERQLRDLRESVMRTRMVPIGTVFERMRFVVHDLARESQKQVTLELCGQETEIDKLVVEQMMDPLMHLVRNAVSHGLELPEERVAQGKPPEARITLRAGAVGDAVLIEIEDDGQGIDTERVIERACDLGLIDDAVGATLAADTLMDILCAPGFSTREQADRASGRGVGMAVVKNAVEKLGGSLALDTQIGRGTHFTIQLPLTLAITDALIVSASGQTFAVPLPLVREVVEVQPAKVTLMEKLQGNEIISYRGGVLSIVRLARFFKLTNGASAQPDADAEHAFYVLVVGETQPVGIAVDRILSQREIVVRAIIDPLIQVPGIAGATELGDGRPILILDVGALTKVKRKT